MAIYLALVFWFFICHLIVQRARLLELLLDVVPTILIIGMRNIMVGADTNMYVSLFENLGYSPQYGNYSALDLQHFGKTFIEATHFLSHIFSSYHSYLLICAIVCILPLAYIAYKENYNLWMFFSTFVLLNGLAGYMNILRQALGMTFCYVGVYFSLKGRYLIAIPFMIIGVLIHPSTIVIPVILLVSIFIQFKYVYILFGVPIGLILFILYTPLLNLFSTYFPSYSYYTSSYALNLYSGGALGAMLQFVVTFMLIALIYLGNKNRDREDEDLYFDGNKDILVTVAADAENYLKVMDVALWFLTFSLAFSIMTLKFSQVSRISYELNMIVIWALPNSIKFVKKNNVRYILILGAFILALSYFLAVQIFRPEWYRIVPYIFGS